MDPTEARTWIELLLEYADRLRMSHVASIDFDGVEVHFHGVGAGFDDDDDQAEEEEQSLLPRFERRRD